MINTWIIDHLGTNLLVLSLAAFCIVLIISAFYLVRGMLMDSINNWIIKKIDQNRIFFSFNATYGRVF